jgi:hypothetical protein
MGHSVFVRVCGCRGYDGNKYPQRAGILNFGDNFWASHAAGGLSADWVLQRSFSLLLGSYHWAMPAFAVLLLRFIIHASFAVFHLPIATGFGWLRADFLMAIARKNVA